MRFSQFFMKAAEKPAEKLAEKVIEPAPGDGLRSLKTTGVFRAVNFELYAKPNMVIMVLGVMAMSISVGYIMYMRSKYEGMGYYTAVGKDGEEVFVKKKSKWET